MNPREHRDNDFTALDELIEDITVDAYGDDEGLWAFRQAFAGIDPKKISSAMAYE